ncbi:MAG TPA: hypothetical protein VKA84_06545 [Gemmatimonadaceae bacterium]|nr:hypothetical protein [Gemmatimonadaceae bacterium]
MPPAVQSFSVTSISAPAVRRPRPTSMEVTSSIDVVGSAPYRVVLRLADAAAGGAIRVWVRTHRGTFERLDESRPVTVASSYAAADSHRRTDLVFRVEADDPRTLDALAIPVACEVVAQADDAVSAYRFTAVLGASRGERPR